MGVGLQQLVYLRMGRVCVVYPKMRGCVGGGGGGGGGSGYGAVLDCIRSTVCPLLRVNCLI